MRFQSVGKAALHIDARVSPGRPVLVFINSLGTDLRIWDEVIAGLGPYCGTLRYDKRGHGLSETAAPPQRIDQHVDDLAGLLDGLGVKNAVVCGLSVGGMIALGLADRRRDLVRGLVLCDTAHRIGSLELWNPRIAAVMADGVEAIADGVLERWFTPYFRRDFPERWAGYRRMLISTAKDGYAGTCAAIRDADLAGAAGRIKVPTLCLVGDQDAATPPALVQSLAGLIPGAGFAAIADAGHLPCIEQPEALAGHLRRFLATTAESSSEALGEDLFDAGMAVRRSVLGDAHVDRAQAGRTRLDYDFQRFITQAAWGSVWSRPGLTRRERSIVTIALLAARGHDEEVAMHVRATANTGASMEDVAEALLHVAIYAGVPAANRAFHIAKKAFKEMEETR